MGDLILNYLTKSEKQTLDTILCPYRVEVLNKSLPTRYCDNIMSLVVYIIPEKNLPLLSSQVFLAQSNVTIFPLLQFSEHN